MAISIPIISEFNNKGVLAAQKSLKNLAKAQIASSIAAGSLLEIARKSIVASNEDAKSQRLLSLAITNATGATAEQAAITDGIIQKMQYQVAVADDELRPALGNLVRVTKDVTAAQDLMSVALDIAAARNISVEQASSVLAKAYAGNIGALKRLGFAISDTTVKNKDFSTALTEIKPLIDGAAKAAADSSDGGWKKLGIAIGDISENVGNNLNNALTPVIEKLTILAQRSNEAASDSSLLNTAFEKIVTTTARAIPALDLVLRLIRDTGNEAEKSAEKLGGSNGLFRMFEQTGMRKWGDLQAQQAAKSKTASDAAAAAANKAKAAEKARFTTFKELLSSTQQQLREYVASISAAIGAEISLSSAFQGAADAQRAASDGITDALQARKQAYAELDQAKANRDATGYAKALKDIEAAEAAVSAAQAVKPKNYTAIFAEQISAAKEFAGVVKQLAAAGLGKAGLAQLLDLGAVAGVQVGKDLLAGTAGLTIGGLNTDLAAVAEAGTQAGMAIPGMSAALGATAGGGAVYNVTVNAGVGDKNEIAKQVVDLLQSYEKRFGSVPIKVKK